MSGDTIEAPAVADPLQFDEDDIGFVEVVELPGGSMPEWASDDEWVTPFEDSWLYRTWAKRVKHGTNDFIVLVCASTRSALSGTGKSTLGIKFCREFDESEDGWNAKEKATLDSHEFAREMISDPDLLSTKSATLFDEAQGTLSDSGADARRSMANSVMDISKALATMRYRQITAVLVTQSSNWLDDRLKDLIDAMVIIQEPGYAVVYHPFRNDLKPSQKYNDRKGQIRWDPLPEDDPDYVYLTELKEKSANQSFEEVEEDIELSRDQKIAVAQRLRNKGWGTREAAEAVKMSKSWVSNNTETASGQE